MKTIYSVIILSVVSIVLSYCIGAFYAYFYPMKFKDEIVYYGGQYGVNPAIVASVANVESGFDENALSNKGAVGVMQLMPTTAEWVATKIGEEYSLNLLYNGQYNIKIATYYISYLLNQFGDEKTALCAYNAGQGNVKNWLKNKEYSTDGITLVKIPFEETKNYINKVEKNYRYYKNRYKTAVNN